MFRALSAFIVAAVVGISGLSLTPSPAFAQYREYSGGGHRFHAQRHHRPRFHGRHYRHGPRHFAPRHFRRHHARPYRYHHRPIVRYHRPYVDFYVPAPRYARPYHGRRVFRLSGSHYQWCHARYRSYRAYDNTFQPYNGPRRQCYSPYS